MRASRRSRIKAAKRRIINVTTYHNQRWDDKRKSPIRINRREERVPVPEQRNAVEAFCLQNQLKFPIAIQERKANYDLCHAYGGNPQIVVIDRDNKIRLIQRSDESGIPKVSDALEEIFRSGADEPNPIESNR